MVLSTDISYPEHIHAHRKFFVFAQKLEKSHINSRSCEGGLLLNGTLATWPTMTDWFVMLVSVGQKRREADVSTALGYISRRRVHTPNQECVWYLVWRGRRGWLGTKRKEEWKRRKGGRKRWRDRGNKEGREREINKGREGGRDQQRKGGRVQCTSKLILRHMLFPLGTVSIAVAHLILMAIGNTTNVSRGVMYLRP